MTAEEMRPMWDWMVDHGSMWDLIHELWPEEEQLPPHRGPLSEIYMAAPNNDGKRFERLLTQMPPEKRFTLYHAIVIKRLTS